jgi:hypothetical protein
MIVNPMFVNVQHAKASQDGQGITVESQQTSDEDVIKTQTCVAGHRDVNNQPNSSCDIKSATNHIANKSQKQQIIDEELDRRERMACWKLGR